MTSRGLEEIVQMGVATPHRRRSAGRSIYIASMASAGVAAMALMSAPAFAQAAPTATQGSVPEMTQSPATATTDGPASAQSAATSAAPQQDDRGNLGDIVVTAQRREESLSRVPVSISAFSAETLKTRVVNREQDLAALVPGLVVKSGQNANQVSFTLRGQTLDPFSGASPAVLTYLNEAPYSGNNSATAFFDFSSVQVLKGPQGTLFGRNATGGAILYSSTMPGDVVGGYLTVRGGERSLAQIQGAIDLPLVADKLAVRLAGDFIRQDGYIKNINTGNTLGDTNNKSIRATVVFTPSESFKNVTVFQYSKFGGSEANGELFSYYLEGETNNGYALVTTLDSVYGKGRFPGVGDGPASPGNFPGGPAGYLAFQKANPFKIFLSYDLPHYSRNVFVSNTSTFDLSDTATIKNIFSYGNSFSRTPGILTGSPFGSIDLYNNDPRLGNGPPGGETFDNERYSNELQLQGTLANDQLKYIIGGFYSHSIQKDYIPVIVGPELAVPLADIAYDSRGKDTSKAVFGQATYSLGGALEGLSFTAGGRYTWESLSMSQLSRSIFGPYSQSKKASAPSWTANIQYQFNPRNQIYFAQRGSWRSGNFNGTTVPFNNSNSFGNEKTYDFELGYKYAGPLAGERAHFNLALYQQHVKNAQRAVYAVINGNPSGFAANVPRVRVRGVEADGDITLGRSLKVGFAGAYTDAVYTNGNVDLSPYIGIPNYFVLHDSYPDAPKWAGSVYADVTLPTPEEWGAIHVRADSFSQTSSYFSSTSGSITPRTKIKGYTTVQLRLSWDDIMQSKFSAGIYAKNLFDRFYYSSGYVEGASGGFNSAIPGEPQTFGAEVTVRF